MLDVNHPTARNIKESISHVCTNKLAPKVKLNDHRSNKDINRITNPTDKDIERQKGYKREYVKLLKTFDNMVHFEDAHCDIKLE